MSLPATAVCDVCGRPFRPATANQRRCSEACRVEHARLYREEWARAVGRPRTRKVYPPRPCAVCLAPFTPGRYNQLICTAPACKAQRKRDITNSLNAGRPAVGDVERVCVVCDAPFLGHVLSLVCSRECRHARANELTRRREGSVPPCCIVCGAELPYQGGTLFTCPEPCRAIARKRRNRRGYETNPGRRVRMVEDRRRRKEADPAYRDHLASLARNAAGKRYSATLAEEAATLERVLAHKETEDAQQPH